MTYIILSNLVSMFLLVAYFGWIKDNKERLEKEYRDKDIRYGYLFVMGVVMYVLGYTFPLLIFALVAYEISEILYKKKEKKNEQ